MRPNVLHLMCSFHQGGSERQAIQLTRLLKESGRYNVHVAVLDGAGVLREGVAALGFREIPEFPLTSFYDSRFIKQLRRFARLLKEREITIFQSSSFYTNIFGLAAARIAGVPVRIGVKRETAGCRTGPQRFVERCSYRLAHAVIANADAVRTMLVKEGVPEKKIVTIHNGLDLSRAAQPVGFDRDSTLAMLGLTGGGAFRYVTMVANLRNPVKNYPMFLRAASLVREAVPEARFIIAGEGSLLEPTRKLAAELGLQSHVFFLGSCQCVAHLLAISDVCALSSNNEGFSNSILEYMAAARPAVVTDVGGAREAIEDGVTGYIVKANDHRAMAARIISLLRDTEMARSMGARARSVVEENFSCEAQLEKTQKLYEWALARAHRLVPHRFERAPQKDM